MPIHAPVALPIFFPIGISRPRLAVFIVFIADGLNRKTIVWAELVIVMFEVVRALSDVGCTIDFGIKEHVRGKQVALCQDIIADYWGFLPGNMKPS